MKIGLYGINEEHAFFHMLDKTKSLEFFTNEHERFLKSDLFLIDTKEFCEFYELKTLLKTMQEKVRVPIFIFNTTTPKTTDALKKTLKLNLNQVLLTKNNNAITLMVAIDDKKAASIDSVNLLQDALIDGYVLKTSTNTTIECVKVIRNLLEANNEHISALLQKYCQRIGANFTYVVEEINASNGKPKLSVKQPTEKKGFGGNKYLNTVKNLSEEFKRLGLQHGFLDTMFQENIIHRACYEDDLPSLEIVMPEKTKEKIRIKSSPDNME